MTDSVHRLSVLLDKDVRTDDIEWTVNAIRCLTCIIADCSAPIHGNGLCAAHWNRNRRYGDPLASKPRPVSKLRNNVTRPGHPLAGANGKIRRARFVLYGKLAGRDAPCHWCHEPLKWYMDEEQRNRTDALYADHLNSVTTDDRPENLVPACNICNTQRWRPGWTRGSKPCLVKDCGSDAVSQGMCRYHYSQWYHEGRPPLDEWSPRFPPTRTYDNRPWSRHVIDETYQQARYPHQKIDSYRSIDLAHQAMDLAILSGGDPRTLVFEMRRIPARAYRTAKKAGLR